MINDNNIENNLKNNIILTFSKYINDDDIRVFIEELFSEYFDQRGKVFPSFYEKIFDNK